MLKYKDKSLPVEVRLKDLLGRMTLKEKIGQLNQRMFGWNAYKRIDNGYQITQEFIDEVAFGDGLGALYGLFRADPWSKVNFENGILTKDCAKVSNMLQRYVIENTRLGIPILFSEECPHGHMALNGTMLPVNIGIGSTWNPELYRQAYELVAAEIRAKGGNLALVSSLDIVRDPRWGRTEECYGEDPYLASRKAEAAVKGLQGHDISEINMTDKVGAVLKHFCAQGASSGGHNGKSAPIGDRELKEIHLPAAKAGVAAGAAGLMAAYNDIDGIYCHVSRKLLTGILRDEWGFEGIVMSDGCAVDNLKCVMGSAEKAVAGALNAAVDLNLWSSSYEKLEAAVSDGLISEKVIDTAVSRVLLLKFRLGLFDNPYVHEDEAIFDSIKVSSRAINLKLVRESIVMLKNEDNILPLKKDLKRIAVIGPNADSVYNQLGDYTPTQRKGNVTTVLQGIKSIVSKGTEVIYKRGCGIRDKSKDGFVAAVNAAKSSDVSILVLGGSSARDYSMGFDSNGAALLSGNASDMDCGEGVDAADLELGGVQVELAKEITSVCKNAIVVLIQGRPYSISWIAENCKAVLCSWYPGSEGGFAVADILFGNVNPSGKLPISFPKSSAQLPVYYNHREDSNYVDMDTSPLYVFGYGLSYTTFKYGAIKLDKTEVSTYEIEIGMSVTASVNVKNVGDREGDEVVQLYINHMGSGISPRVMELKGFEKISLSPGEKRIVTFNIGFDELGSWDDEMNFTVASGCVKVMIGSSSKLYNEILLNVI